MDNNIIDEEIEEPVQIEDTENMVKIQVSPEHCIYYDGILADNLKSLKRDTIKKDYDTFIIMDGIEGCLTGDTLIQINRAKISRRYTLKGLYNRYHPEDNKIKKEKHIKGNWDKKLISYVRSYNGKEIKLHPIKDVSYSGKKEVFKITLENGYNIKATSNHKIMTREGWIELKDLKLNESEVMYDTLKAEKSNRLRIKLYDILLNVRNHPYSNVAGRVEVHRLIYESYKNNLLFTEYLDLLLNEPYKLNQKNFIDPSIYHIHHKDGNHYNNSIENLECLTNSEHHKKHSNEMYQNFSQGIPKFSKLISIEPMGIEDTFDIQCEDPIHNFVANGIVVHNSGKTTMSFQIAMYFDPTFCLDRVCFTIEQFINAVEKAEKYQCIVFDETMGYLASRSSMSKFNRLLIKVFSEMRSKNLFIILNIPSIFELDKYPAIHRSVALIHIYKRGRFAVYNYTKKKLLYIYGKKFYSYANPSPDFIGMCVKYFPLNKLSYEQKKQQGISNFSAKTKLKEMLDKDKPKQKRDKENQEDDE